MPTYVYKCELVPEEQGHGEFEEFHSISEDAKLTECPHCRKDKDISTKVTRLISGGSGRGIVELTGRDLIDKTKADAAVFKREVHQKESLYANVLGESKYQSLQQQMDKNRR
jgi:hypothetical protein